MTKNFRIALQATMFLVLIIYSIYSINYFVKTDMWVKYKDCGVVVGSSSEDRPIKHGTQTTLYLLIEFERDGFQAQEVGATTYFKYKDRLGQKLCFEQSERNPVMKNYWNTIHYFFGAGFILIYFLILLVIFIGWCLGDYDNKKK